MVGRRFAEKKVNAKKIATEMVIRRRRVARGWFGRGVIAGLFVLSFALGTPVEAQQFIRADANADGNTNLDDVVFIAAYLYADGPAPAVIDAADANDDGFVDLGDIQMILELVFLGGAFPPAPFPFPGTDPTASLVAPAPLATTSLSLPDLDVVPGADDLTLPVLLSSVDTLRAIEIALVHDPAAVVLGSFDVTNTILGIAGVEYIQQEVSNDPADPYAWLSVIADFSTPVTGHFIPGGNDLPVARLSASIPFGASAPQVSTIAFVQSVDDPPKRTVVVRTGGECRAPVTSGGAISIEVTFTRGDSNHDCLLDISDAVFAVGYLFQGGTMPPCEDAADTNNDGILNIADPIYLLNYLFQEGPAPSAPFPLPGLDPDGDALDCAVQSSCAGG